jgi:hypothetical protein
MMVFLSLYIPLYSFNGYMETAGAYFPNKEDIFESRTRILLEEKAELTDCFMLYLSSRIDGLLSNRDAEKNELLVKINDMYFDFYISKIEIKFGYSKVFWGKLDQLSPTDIINPLDVSRLFMTSERKEAKLPVALFMMSSFLGKTSSCDFILVPLYKKGVYDELNEQSSPFYIIDFPLPIEEHLPSKSVKNIEYGLRFSSTCQEVDYSLYYFKGFQDFSSYRLEQQEPLTKIEARYFKSDMFGYDFEFVVKRWGIRGEGAFFNDIYFQKKAELDYTKGASFINGLGVDRGFGDNYLNIGVLYKKIFVEEIIEDEEDEVTITANVERNFSYETKKLSCFLIYNIFSRSLFINGILSINMLKNLWLDITTGIFNGKGHDSMSKFTDNDFFLIKGRYYF